VQIQEAQKYIQEKLKAVNDLTGVPLKLEIVHNWQTHITTRQKYDLPKFYIRLDFENSSHWLKHSYNSDNYKLGRIESDIDDIICQVNVVARFLDFLIHSQIVKKENKQQEEDKKEQQIEIPKTSSYIT
jgi:hypothetical protein